MGIETEIFTSAFEAINTQTSLVSPFEQRLQTQRYERISRQLPELINRPNVLLQSLWHLRPRISDNCECTSAYSCTRTKSSLTQLFNSIQALLLRLASCFYQTSTGIGQSKGVLSADDNSVKETFLHY